MKLNQISYCCCCRQ